MLPAFPSIRIASSLLFLMNGLMVGSWAARVPDFMARMSINTTEMGTVFLALGIGSLILMPLNGRFISRFGTFWLMMPQAVVACFFFPILTATPTLIPAIVLVFIAGGVLGGMDVAMNSNAVLVERQMKTAVMSSLHGFWSLGAGLGSLIGSRLLVATDLMTHALLVSAACALMIAIAWPLALKDRGQSEEEKQQTKGKSVFKDLLPWLVGFMALFTMFPEGAVIDWAKLYLETELSVDPSIAGDAFAAFAFTMAALRFAGDSVRNRFGAVRTFRYSALLSALGFILASTAPSLGLGLPGIIIGFAIAGIGIANTVPICFSAAGNLKGYPPGAAIAVVTVLGYSGLLFVPPLIGFVSEATGFAPVFFTMSLVVVSTTLGAHLLRDADL